MKISSLSCCTLGLLLASPSVAATERVWNGGDGSWQTPAKWKPEGVPGSAADDIAAIPAPVNQTISVTEDVVLGRINMNTDAEGVQQRLNIASGHSVTTGVLRVRSSKSTDLTVCGGGKFTVKDRPVNIGDQQPVTLTVADKGTRFAVLKDLYLGALEKAFSSNQNTICVTDGATLAVGNEVSIGLSYKIDDQTEGVWSETPPAIIVDNGGTLSAPYVNVGRGGTGILAITNGTLGVYQIGHRSLRADRPSVFCAKDSTLVAKEHFVVGSRYNGAFSTNAICEVTGGTLTAGEVNVGKYPGSKSTAVFRGLKSFSADRVICGDTAGATLASLTIADMASGLTTGRIFVGNGASGAKAMLTNVTMTVDTDLDILEAAKRGVNVGRSGASNNELVVCDSTVTQKGGHLYIGDYNTCMGNVLKIENSIFDYQTTGGKGDVIVGIQSGSVSNKIVVLRGGILKYNRAWMALGQNEGANGNAIELDGGSSLQAPNSYLKIGQRGSNNRLSLANGSSTDTRSLDLANVATLAIAGTGNSIQVGDKGYSVADGCSFVFAPNGPAVKGVPMLTINKNLGYSSKKKIYVRVDDTCLGDHTLVTSTETLPAAVVGENVVIEGLPESCRAKVYMSADGKSLHCEIMRKGLYIFVR